MNDMGNVKKTETKWFWARSFTIFMIVSVGPFALPLVLMNPRLTWKEKLLWTVGILVLTYLSIQLLSTVINKVMNQYKELGI